MEKENAAAKIAEDYQKFNISPEQTPAYENPYQFAQTFKQCSVVEYKNIFYSNTTAVTEPHPKK